jgi:CRP-like cAMP-binding protein
MIEQFPDRRDAFYGRTTHPLPHLRPQPLTERLDTLVGLNTEERHVIATLTASRRVLRAKEIIVHEGTRPDRIYLIVRGVAFRYRYLANGRRQIFGYLLPGDLCDTHFVILNESDHNVGLLSDTEVAVIPLAPFMNAMVKYPRIERALLMMSLVDAAMLRESLLNVGQRDAFQKLAHFFCELGVRLNALGIHDATHGFSIPLTQTELADTMGLTVVHVNRILQRFRREGLLSWSRRHFDVVDWPRLRDLAGFDGSYLRLPEATVQLPMAASA